MFISTILFCSMLIVLQRFMTGVHYNALHKVTSIDYYFSFHLSFSWQVTLPSVVGLPRVKFCLGCYNRSAEEAELVVFGGTQNFLPESQYSSPITDTTLLYLGTLTIIAYTIMRRRIKSPLKSKNAIT